MTDIMGLAREAGASPYVNRHFPGVTYNTFSPETLQRFADLIRVEAIPPGYVVVPEVPTEKMCEAATTVPGLANAIYTAMLQAAKEQQK